MNYYENLKHGTNGFPVGIYDTVCEKGFNLYPHIHREFEFLVMKKGRGKLYIDGEEYCIKAGDAIFINSEELHVGVEVDEKTAEFFAVVFSPEIFGSFGDDVIMNKYVLPVMNKRVQFAKKYDNGSDALQKNVVDMLERVRKVYKCEGVGYELCVKSILMQVWEQCFTNSKEQTGNTAERVVEDIKKVFTYIQEEYDSPISLGDMASKVNMGREYFCRRFSEIMHMTPFEYLLRVRIENSCRLLLSTKLTIGEIAEESGFNSFSYFSKTFKSFVGCTPREYRKRREKHVNDL